MSNLVVNGNFSNGLNSWNVNNVTTGSFSGDFYPIFLRPSSSLSQLLSTNIGTTYTLTFLIRTVSTNSYNFVINFGTDTRTINSQSYSNWTQETYTFTASLSNTILDFQLENNVGTIMIDNVSVIASEKPSPTIGDLSIDTKTYGDSPFTIQQPTSNSTGAFTYTSSHLDVATIINTNQINIVGVGNTLITATQAETLEYNSGSVNTNFEVIASSPTNPVIIDNEDGLTYFMNTGSKYGEITTDVVVNENLVASSEKVLSFEDNDLSIVKTNIV